MSARRRAVVGGLLGFLFAVSVAWGAGGERGFSGYLAVSDGKVLAEENAERLFVPGSVHKLVVSAAALHYLGSDRRVVTRLVAVGSRRGNVLDGDLVVLPAADPTWNKEFFSSATAPLDALARGVVASGVRRVEGDLVVDLGRFPGRSFPPTRAVSEVPFGYAAPTAALAVNEGILWVEMGPGPRVGAPGILRRISREPEGLSLVLENRIRTVGPERYGEGTVDFLPSWEEDRLVVRGEYPVNEPSYRMELADPRPELTAAFALRQALAKAGVTVMGGVRIEHGGTAAGQELARWQSPPVGEWLPRILEDSHNWTAEMLLRVLAAEVRAEGRDTTGLELLESFLVEVVGVPEDSFVLDDASGLSPYDLLAPRTVVQLLAWVGEQPWRALFVEALAAPAEGTLGAWPGMSSVAAKTGTVRHSLALAGYLDPNSPQPILFAIFLNHRPEERPGLRAELVHWLREVRRKNP